MKTFLRRFLIIAPVAVALASLSAGHAVASVTYIVTVDTSSKSGQSGFIDMQFNPGGVSQPATAQVVNFNAGGGSVTGSPSTIGDVSGVLPGTVTFVNDQPLNDYTQGITFGSSVSFLLVLSGPAVDSPNGDPFGSSFFLSFLDSTGANFILTNQSGTGVAGEVDINTATATISTTAFPNAGGGPTVVTFNQLVADSFQISDPANLLIGDSYVNVTNAGTRNGFDPAGGICANFYVFDPSEELIACCACYVSPDGLKSLSAKQDLVSNTLTPGVPGSVVIKLLASTPVGTTCNPSSPTFASLEPGLRAWSTDLHQNTTSGNYQVTENAFQFAGLSASELTKLTTFCGFIQANGSTFGICKSCRFGGLGGAQQ